MSLRTRLLATVALPVLSTVLWVQPAAADTTAAPIILAQEGDAPAQPAPLPQEAEPAEPTVENDVRREADEQMKAAEEEAARQAQELEQAAREAREQAEAEQNAAEEEAAKRLEQQQLEAQQAADKQEQELQKAAQEARERAREEHKAAEEEAARQVEEQRQAAEQEAERQAQELEAEALKAKEQTEQEQKAAEEEAARQVEEQRKAAEQENQRQLDEQKAVEDQAKKEAEESRQEIEQTEPGTADAPPQVTPEQPLPDAPTVDQGAPDQPATPSDAPLEPEAPVTPTQEQPAGDPQPADQTHPEQEAQNPVPEINDQRTVEEKLEAAQDPTKTDDTVVLPVDNGAAILDSDKDADNAGGEQSRAERRKQREQQRGAREDASPPADDAAAQATVDEDISANLSKALEANLSEEGRRIDEAPVFMVPETTNIVNNTIVNNTTINNIDNRTENVRVVERRDNRVVLDVGNRSFVRSDDRPRLRRNAEETYYEELPRGRVRETIIRPGGYEIITIYDRYGDIQQRSRVDRDGNEYLMLYSPEYEDRDRRGIVDVGYDLPPMRLPIPVSEYIIDVADDPDRDFYDFFAQPPVERVERLYTIDEVRHSARLRDKLRRIDLDTIQFATGSAEVSLSQAKTLRKVADAMQQALDKDPGETFFIEGHTDAVGSDRSNLILSDQRAESVAILLSEVYDIPAENLITQGYGERYLKIKTQSAEQENRRVTMRRVTPLVRPVAQR